MGDFKKNPKKPFEVRVPNKIRKRIAMHEKEDSFLTLLRANAVERASLFSRTVDVLSREKSVAPKRGSMWSRFTNRIKKFLR